MELYRSISLEESEDLEATGIFRAKEGQYEGKLFASSFADACKFGLGFFKLDQKPFVIVKVTIDDEHTRDFSYEYYDEYLVDGLTIGVDRDYLNLLNQNMIFEILDFVQFTF